VDDVDHGQEREQLDRELALRETLSRIAKADEHGDGICAGCGEPIGARRLKAKPQAMRCIECQDRWERHGV